MYVGTCNMKSDVFQLNNYYYQKQTRSTSRLHSSSTLGDTHEGQSRTENTGLNLNSKKVEQSPVKIISKC